MTDFKLPGRLGSPAMSFADDPRADPRIAAVAAMAALAADVEAPGPDPSYEEALQYAAAFEASSESLHPSARELMPDFSDVESSEQIIKGIDDNDIILYIDRPKDQVGKLPGIVHIHGGGMVIMTAADPNYIRWRKSLAQTGLVIIGVEYRNGGGRLGNHPFPAGLNDCAAATRWTHANRGSLGISTITVSGESGGGNLSLATAIKARREGWSEQISGVYALCPYICGHYLHPPKELLSLVENDTYMLDSQMMNALVKVYDPTGEHADNPLAWPLQASEEDLKGLPAHVISVNELDPLRDEGLAYYRKLVSAGVAAVAKTVNGTPHGGDMTFVDIAPEITDETVRSVSGFAKSVG